MTWHTYIDLKVEQLADARSRAQFDTIVDQIHKALDNANASSTLRGTVWETIRERYRTAPKLILKEATAAAALFALQQAADQVLADAGVTAS